jgi:hypothetical protein
MPFCGNFPGGIGQYRQENCWKMAQKAEGDAYAILVSTLSSEVIPANLVFSNDSKAPWHLWNGTYDRSGRIADIAFKAEEEKGSPVKGGEESRGRKNPRFFLRNRQMPRYAL